MSRVISEAWARKCSTSPVMVWGRSTSGLILRKPLDILGQQYHAGDVQGGFKDGQGSELRSKDQMIGGYQGARAKERWGAYGHRFFDGVRGFVGGQAGWNTSKYSFSSS
jgi:hypothetical protein